MNKTFLKGAGDTPSLTPLPRMAPPQGDPERKDLPPGADYCRYAYAQFTTTFLVYLECDYSIIFYSALPPPPLTTPWQCHWMYFMYSNYVNIMYGTKKIAEVLNK